MSHIGNIGRKMLTAQCFPYILGGTKRKDVLLMKKKEGTVTPISVALAPKYDATKERDENIVGQRIAEARKKKGMSIAAFSDYLENFGVKISTGGAGKWETGYSIPNAYQLIAICTALDIQDQIPFFMSNYAPALNSEGERKVAEYKEDLIASGKYRPAPRLTAIRRIERPVYEMPVSAGTGNFLDDGRFEMVSVPENMLPEGTDFGVRVTGDSMEPMYHDGQIAWVKECAQVNIGEVGIFIYDGEGFIKVYDEQEPDEDHADDYTDSYGVVHNQPVLVSLNEKYADRIIAPGRFFKTVGKVL